MSTRCPTAVPILLDCCCCLYPVLGLSPVAGLGPATPAPGAGSPSAGGILWAADVLGLLVLEKGLKSSSSNSAIWREFFLLCHNL